MDFESDNFGVFASSRRSTRDFLPTPIPDEIIEEIIADLSLIHISEPTRPY